MKTIDLKVFPCVWFLSILMNVVHGAHILFFVPANSYSHRVTITPLVEALAARGHQVTFISPHQPKQFNANITNIVPVTLAQHIEKVFETEFDVQVRSSGSQVLMLHSLFEYGYDSCKVLYDSPEFQTWLQTGPIVDLVIADHCFCMECAYGVAHKLGSKYLAFNALPVFPFEYDTFGYLPESSAIPEMEVQSFRLPMGFFERVGNTLMSLRWRLQYNFYANRMDELVRRKLQVGDDMPFIGDLVANSSLIFYTGDVLTDYPRALPPNHINIAGMHCIESDKELPPNVVNFLEDGDGDDGFVYISFGSLVNPSNMPLERIQLFFQVIRSFPRVKFLWKWNDDFPKEAPTNVLFSKWFPQNDVLAHKRIRGFVTQGGRPSTMEAVWNGVPMISFPILCDQDYNTNRMVEWGVATKLEIGTVTVEEFKEAIHKTVYETTMKIRMEALKKLFRDRQNDPLETAVWWTEYVLRTPNAWHLKPAGHSQNWFIRRQVDVWAFLTGSFVLVTVFVGKVLLALLKMCRKGKKEKVK